jgi:hypothetical protein
MSSSNAIVQEATNLMSQYPVYSPRRDLTSRDYIKYKMEWETFNRVWIYNYTAQKLSIITATNLPDYEFPSENERMMYILGQTSHISAYPNAPPGMFDTVVNFSTIM